MHDTMDALLVVILSCLHGLNAVLYAVQCVFTLYSYMHSSPYLHLLLYCSGVRPMKTNRNRQLVLLFPTQQLLYITRYMYMHGTHLGHSMYTPT